MANKFTKIFSAICEFSYNPKHVITGTISGSIAGGIVGYNNTYYHRDTIKNTIFCSGLGMFAGGLTIISMPIIILPSIVTGMIYLYDICKN